MNKEQAKAAMREGAMVTHPLFSDLEFIRMVDGSIRDENDYVLNSFWFWGDRTEEAWEENWTMYKGNKMTDSDFENLNILHAKLGSHIGKPFCVMPEYIGDGAHIAVYDSSGKVERECIGVDLKDAVHKLMAQS